MSNICFCAIAVVWKLGLYLVISIYPNGNPLLVLHLLQEAAFINSIYKRNIASVVIHFQFIEQPSQKQHIYN